MCTNTKQKLRGRSLKLRASKPKSNPNPRKSSCEWNTLCLLTCVIRHIMKFLNISIYCTYILLEAGKMSSCPLWVLFWFISKLQQICMVYENTCMVKCNLIFSSSSVLAMWLHIMQVIYLCYSYPVYKVMLIHLFCGLIRQKFWGILWACGVLSNYWKSDSHKCLNT